MEDQQADSHSSQDANLSSGHRPASDAAKKDRWDKAQILSGFFSGVVIAVIGFVISSSIQRAQIASSESTNRAQIEAARQTAQEQRRLQEGQLAAQFVGHLLSKDAREREIAVLALSASLPRPLVEEMLAVLARRDSDARVREAAIERLGQSNTTDVARALTSIAGNADRTVSERQLAAMSGREAGLRQFLPQVPADGGAVLFASTSDASGYYSNEFNATVFGHFVRVGLNGMADLNRDGRIKASELQTFLVTQFRAYGTRSMVRGVRPPVVAGSGVDFTLIGSEVPYSNAVGLILRLSDYDDGYGFEGFSADRVGDLLAQKIRLSREPVESPRNRFNVLKALDTLETKVGSNDLLIIYYAGYATVDDEGVGKWLLYSPRANDTLSGPELSALMQRIGAKYKAVFMDVGFGVAPQSRLR